MLAKPIDTALDTLVAPGFSRLGYAVRSRGWADLPRLDGRTVAITGPTGGIGEAAAEGLAALGASLILLVRNPEKGRALAAKLGGSPRVIECDLSDLASVRAAAAQIDELHVLINNAGVMPDAYATSADGFELTFATNVLGMFALTEALLPALKASAPGRIITVSSGGMYGQRLDVEAVQGTAKTGEDFSGVRAYARTKRAEVVLSDEWARRLAGTGVSSYSMHPGWVNTPGLQQSLPGFARLTGPVLRTPEQGADTIVWLAAAPEAEVPSGGFWHDRRTRPEHRMRKTHEAPGDAARLYDLCTTLTTPTRED
ncbi:MAG: SDR family NAD(P)-dependent oxidoreductase [Solirubrobacteraceae bacterium]|nr:SDR family NAD(P)-dependent oxidoreductase [Solirubrobacteraceae bacterium]